MAMNPRLLRPRASGFNPKSLAGLVGWYDASQSSTITVDGNGNVSQWNDISGASTVRNASQSTSASRPAYTSAGLNGKNIVSFDGASSFLSFTGASRTDETLLCVATVNITAGVNKQNPIVADASAGYGLNVSLNGTLTPTTASVFFDAAGTANLVTRSIATGLAAPFGPSVISVARDSAGSWQVRYDGFGGTVATTSNAVTLARFGASATLRLNGVIAEVILYDRKLSLSQVQLVERYLAGKWGLALA